MSFLTELQRRNVFRVGIAYVVASWVVLQVADLVLENINAPDWVMQAIMLVVAIGLPLVLLFAWIFEMTPEGLKRESEVDRSQSMTAKTGRKLDRMITGILVVAVAYLLVDKLVLQKEMGSEPFSPKVSEQATGAGDEKRSLTPAGPSIAVLPFVNMSGDQDNEYFSDGLTETLLHMLAQLPDLRVAARTSSFSYKGKDAGIAEIAGALGVAHILEGSVQKAGGQVRVTAQLIRAEDGFHVWSQNYTRPLEDIFAIQDEIAEDVANALDASLLGGKGSAMRGLATRDVPAYEAYLKALDQQASFSYGSLKNAEGLFKQALALDPEFMDARLGLVRNYLLMHGTGLLTRAETIAAVEPLLAQVRTRHPDDAHARAYGLLLKTEYPEVFTELTLEEREAAMNELRSLLAVIPDDWLVRWRVAQMVEFFEDDPQAAMEVLEAGLLIDPRSAFLYSRIGDQLRTMDRFEEAETALHRALELDPELPGIYTRLARLAEDRNDLLGRLRWMRRAVEADPQDHELASSLALDFYDLRLTEEGDRWASRVKALVPGSDFERRLDVIRAESQQDWEQVMQLAGAMIEGQASQREGIFSDVTFAFSYAAVQLGREREAYEFVLSARPEAANLEQPPSDISILDLRMSALFLMREFADRSETVRAWDNASEHLQAMGWDWREEPGMRMFDRVVRGDIEGAVPEALALLSKPLARDLILLSEFELPSMASVIEQPEVASRIAEVQNDYQTMRQSVIDMVAQPEWTE